MILNKLLVITQFRSKPLNILNLVRFTSNKNFIKLTEMPPKKTAAKRKADEVKSPVTPLYKDPFSAAKKNKKPKDDDDVCEIIEEKKVINDNKEEVETKVETKVEKKAKSRSPSPVKEKEDPPPAKKATKKSVKKEDDSKENIVEDDNENDDAPKEEKEKKTNGNVSKNKYDKEEFKKASNGKDWNLKIVSWNINGIRAWLEKDGIDYIKAEDPDIFCCQETKCDKSKIPPKAELHSYHCYWLSGDTQGYSGVGLLSKVKPIKVSYGINDKKFDGEGRVIVAEYEKFILINTYIPNSGRGLDRLGFRVQWEEAFRKFLASLEKQKPIIWTGDLNVAHNPIDLKNPTTNTKTAGFTKEERECFTKILSDGYFDSFRHLYPAVTDAYTFWSYLRNSRANNVGWRLDYFVLSEKLKENLVDNVIRAKVLGSDHCPIVSFLKF